MKYFMDKSNNLKHDESEKLVEIVLKSVTQKLWDLTNTNMGTKVISGLIQARKYNTEGMYYTFINLETGNYHKSILEIFRHYYNMLKNGNIESVIALNKKPVTIKDADEAIKIISIQPNSYDSKIQLDFKQ